MKELSIGEKAKRYDEAVERAKNFIENGDERERTIAESIFAGLMEESEDERIRKALKEFFVNSFQNNGVAAICGVHIKDVLAWLEKQGEQKPTEWSEDDQSNFCELRSFIVETYRAEDASRLITWLKSLKDRVLPQPKQEWSKEDESFYQRLEQIICKVDIEAFQGDRDLHSWLRSLRPQNRWKPSDEQMEVLQWCMPLWVEPKSKAVLESLIEDLKKLREE